MTGDGAATRDRLIAAAVTLFQARGYHAVGLSEILSKARAPKGSLYHHFPGGKAELAEVAIEWLRDEIVGFLDGAAESGTPPDETISDIVRGTAKWLKANNFRQGALLAILGQEVAAGDERVTAAVAHAYQAVLQAFCRILATGDPPLGRGDAVAIIAMLDGAVAVCRATRSTEPLRDVSAAIGKLLED